MGRTLSSYYYYSACNSVSLLEHMDMVLIQSLWTDSPVMLLPLIKSTKLYAILFPSQNCEEEKLCHITGWERGIRSTCLIPPVGNCIHSCVSEYLFYPTSFKSRWKLRPSESNSIMKRNYNYYDFNGSLFLQTAWYRPNLKLLKSTEDWQE